MHYDRTERAKYYINLVVENGYNIDEFLSIILSLEEELFNLRYQKAKDTTLEDFSGEFLAK
jgi:RecJ-like exonuclease